MCSCEDLSLYCFLRNALDFFMMNVQSLRGLAGSTEVILVNTSCENSLDSKLSSALNHFLAAP